MTRAGFEPGSLCSLTCALSQGQHSPTPLHLVLFRKRAPYPLTHPPRLKLGTRAAVLRPPLPVGRWVTALPPTGDPGLVTHWLVLPQGVFLLVRVHVPGVWGCCPWGASIRPSPGDPDPCFMGCGLAWHCGWGRLAGVPCPVRWAVPGLKVAQPLPGWRVQEGLVSPLTLPPPSQRPSRKSPQHLWRSSPTAGPCAWPWTC